MKTSFVHKIHEIIKEKGFFKTGRDFSSYLVHTNYTNDTNNRINKEGWPKGFEFIEDYKTSWLNLCSYIYHLGRPDRSFEGAKRHAITHGNEIKGNV